MNTIKATVETELIVSEDGVHTYEVIKRLPEIQGDCGYLISLYPTRNATNIFSNDSTLNHIVNHLPELGLGEIHLINLFSKVVQGKMSTRGLTVDADNMEYIDSLISNPKFQSGKFIVAWGNSMANSKAVAEAKEEILKMYSTRCPGGKLYQLAVQGRKIAGDSVPHPLYLGIRAGNAVWELQEYMIPDQAKQAATTTKQVVAAKKPRKK